MKIYSSYLSLQLSHDSYDAKILLSSCKPGYFGYNQFQFHLNQFLEYGYLQKTNASYTLTDKGKEYANRIDSEEMQVKQQAKISAWVCCRRKRNGKNQYLIYTRLKQPFYGCQGWMSGKVKYGERVVDATQRELKEETNLEGIPYIVAVKHYRVFDEDTNELLEDKFMFLCLVEEPQGKLRSNKEGHFEWVNEEDFGMYVTNPFETYEAFLQQVQLIKTFNGSLQLFEEEHYSKKF